MVGRELRRSAGGFADFGFAEVAGDRGVFAASQAGWDLLEGCWMSGEGFWAVELVRGGLRVEIASWLVFWSEGTAGVCGGGFGL